MTPTRLALCTLLVVPLAACDPQTDGDYKGEPLLTMTGTVQNPAQMNVPEGIDLVIAYFVQPTDPNAGFCIYDAKAAYDAGQEPDLACRFPNLAPERVEVNGEFPSSFRFDLLHPPPSTAQFTAGPITIANASIFAVRKGSAADGELLLGDLVGYSQYGLTYVGSDVPAGTCAKADDGSEVCVDGPVKAGFYVSRGICGGMTVMNGTNCSVPADGEPITVQLADLHTIVTQSTYTFVVN